jgi:chromosome segregation ATPase
MNYQGIDDEQVILKTSWLGFNKKQVLDYIDLLRKEHKEAVSVLQSKLTQAEASCSELNETLKLDNKELERLKSLVQGNDEKIARLSKEVGLLAPYAKESEDKSRQIEALERSVAAAEKRIIDYERKSNIFNELHRATEDILIDSRRRVDSLEKDVNEQMRTADEFLRGSMARAMQDAKDLRDSVESVGGKTSEMLESIAGRVEEMEEMLKSVEQSGKN